MTFPKSAGLEKARIQGRTLWTLEFAGQLAVRCLLAKEGEGYELQWRIDRKWRKPKRAHARHTAGTLLRATAENLAEKMGARFAPSTPETETP